MSATARLRDLTAIACLAATAGFWLGVRHAPPAPAAVNQPDIRSLLEEHRRAILLALPRTAPAPSACPAVASAAAPVPPTEAPEMDTHAVQQAEAALEDALRVRQWDAPQAAAFREALAPLPPAQQHDLMRRLMVAINGGALRVTLQGPPL